MFTSAQATAQQEYADETNRALEASTAQLAQAEDAARELAAQVKELEEASAGAAEAAATAEQELAAAKSEAGAAQGAAQDAATQLEQQQALAAQVQQLHEEAQAQTAALEEAGAKLEAATAAAGQASAETDELRAQMVQDAEAQDQMQGLMMQHMEKGKAAEDALAASAAQVAELQAQLATATSEDAEAVQGAQQTAKAAEESLAASVEQVAALQAQLATATAEDAEDAEATQGAQQKAKAAEDALAASVEQVAELQAQLATAVEAADAAQGAQPSPEAEDAQAEVLAKLAEDKAQLTASLQQHQEAVKIYAGNEAHLKAELMKAQQALAERDQEVQQLSAQASAPAPAPADTADGATAAGAGPQLETVTEQQGGEVVRTPEPKRKQSARTETMLQEYEEVETKLIATASNLRIAEAKVAALEAEHSEKLAAQQSASAANEEQYLAAILAKDTRITALREEVDTLEVASSTAQDLMQRNGVLAAQIEEMKVTVRTLSEAKEQTEQMVMFKDNELSEAGDLNKDVAMLQGELAKRTEELQAAVEEKKKKDVQLKHLQVSDAIPAAATPLAARASPCALHLVAGAGWSPAHPRYSNALRDPIGWSVCCVFAQGHLIGLETQNDQEGLLRDDQTKDLEQKIAEQQRVLEQYAMASLPGSCAAVFSLSAICRSQFRRNPALGLRPQGRPRGYCQCIVKPADAGARTDSPGCGLAPTPQISPRDVHV